MKEKVVKKGIFKYDSHLGANAPISIILPNLTVQGCLGEQRVKLHCP